MNEDNNQTPGILRTSIQLFWRGASAGAISILVILFAFWFVFLPLRGFWKLTNFTFSEIYTLTLVGLIASLIGFVIGGIGGLLMGNLWKNRRAAGVGGAVLTILLLIGVFFIIPCGFIGGC